MSGKKGSPLQLVIDRKFRSKTDGVIETYECGHQDIYEFPYQPAVKRRCEQCNGEEGVGWYRGHYCR